MRAMSVCRSGLPGRSGLPIKGRQLAALILGLVLGLPTTALAQSFVRTGTYIGDGGPSQSVTNIGIAPALVLVKAESTGDALVRTADMSAGMSRSLGGDTAATADRVVSLDADGFTVGGAAEVNTAGVTYHWVAMEAAAGLLETGQYVGDGSGLRGVPLSGMEPLAVLVFGADGHQAALRHASMPTLRGYALDGTGPIMNSFTDFGPDVFYVGSSNAVNVIGETYYYVAWATSPEAVAGGSYAGDGVAGRAISGLGMTPEWVVLVSDADVKPVHRPTGLAGDASLFFTADSAQGNRIQGLGDGQFVVGNDLGVNGFDAEYYWLSFANPGAQADLAVDLQADDAAPEEAQVVSLTLSVRNLGPSATTGVQVTGLLPAGLELQTASPSQGTFDGPSGAWIIGDLAAAAAESLVITALVSAGTAGQDLDVSMTVAASDLPDIAGANDSATLTLRVQAPQFIATGSYMGYDVGGGSISGLGFRPDLVMVKSATSRHAYIRTASMPAGESRRMADTLGNQTDRIVSLDADGFSYGGLPAVDEDETVYYWVAMQAREGLLEIGTYTGDGGANRSIPLTNLTPAAVMVLPTAAEAPVFRHDDMLAWSAYSLDGSGQIANSITAFGADRFDVSSSVSTNSAGETYHYVAWQQQNDFASSGFYVGNSQPGRDISGLGLNPEFVMVASAASVPAVFRPTSLTGDTALFFENQSPRADVVKAMWNGAFQVGADPSVNASATDYYWLALGNPGQRADLGVTVSVDDDRPVETQTVVLTLEGTNYGPDPVTDMEITNILPAGLTFQSAAPGLGTFDDATGTWTVGPVASGAKVGLILTADVDAGTAGSTLTDFALVSGSSLPDYSNSNDSATVSLTVLAAGGADLQVSATVDDPEPAELQPVTFGLDVINNGPDDATGTALAVSLPGTLTYQGAVAEAGTYDAGSGTWTVGNVAAGDTISLALTAEPQAGTAGATLTTSVAIASADQTDANAANNTAAVEITVRNPDIQVSKFVDEPNPAEGATVSFSVAVSNIGQGQGQQVEVQDLLPAGLTFASAVITVGTYDSASGIWSVGTMSPGSTVSLFMTATVDAGTAGSTLTNTASLAGILETEANPDNNAASVSVTVIGTGGVDLQVAHVVDETSPNPDDVVGYTITVYNAGTGTGTGIVVQSDLPPEVTFLNAFANKGSFDPGSGLWDIGDLAEGFQAVLNIQARVEAAAAGKSLPHAAFVTAADQPDPIVGNNAATATIDVPVSDLVVALGTDDTAPAAGDTVRYRVLLSNAGPNPGSGIEVTALLPEGATLTGSAATGGTFAPETATWSLSSLNPALAETLTVDALIGLEAAGTTLTCTAAITAARLADPDPANNTATVAVTVPGADLGLALLADVPVSFEGSSVSYRLTLENAGPDAAAAVMASQPVPAGLVFQTAAASQGSYDPGPGLWDVGGLAPGAAATLDVTVEVAPGTVGSVITTTASLVAGTPADPVPENGTASADLTVWPGIPAGQNVVWPLVGPTRSVAPGADGKYDVLGFAFANRSTGPDTLTSLALTNLTPGPGSSAEADAEWQPLLLTASLGIAGADLDPAPRAGLFSDGQARFSGLDWIIPAGDTLFVNVTGGASLQARDAARLQIGVSAAEDLGLGASFTLAGTWPLVSGQALVVDGFVAAQAGVVPRPAGLLPIGSQRNLALAVDLPGNGYLADSLSAVSVANLGTAQPVIDIAALEFWADDGDDLFDPANDTLLGAGSFSGDRWQLTGLAEPVPAAGRRIFASVDISETARPARDIRLGLPVGNGYAVEMFSGNDGPVDASLENPATLGISVTDRIILTPEWFLAGVALPGDADRTLLAFTLANTYTTSKTLDDLIVTNTSVAPGATAAERDRICQQVVLRLDGNGNGELDDTETDPLLGSGTFGESAAGRVSFGGLDLELPPDSVTRLFVTADLGLHAVADGDRISGEISTLADLSIPQAAVVASWPVRSGSEWLANGMIAEQVATAAIPVLTLGPGEGPVVALDLTIPGNGYLADMLNGLVLVNSGSAEADDLLEAGLWADDGDGAFSAAADAFLGPLTVVGDTWTSTALAEPVPASGLRLFASLTVAATPRDSVTVTLGVPTDGITVASGNDGPLDDAVPGTGTLVISTSPLRSAVSFASAATDTGQSGTVVMTVRNAGSETVTGIDPDLTFRQGAGLITLGLPIPATIAALDPGQTTEITWSFTSSLPGTVVLQGNAQGLVNGSQVRRSIVTPTAPHRVFTPVPRLDLFPTANLPFSINRGQQGLVPLTLTFHNPGDADVANAELTALRIRLLEAEDGPGIVPSELLDRVVVSEGTNVYVAATGLPTSGDEIDLVFDEPVVITGAEPVTLGVRLDLRLNSTAPSFLVSIEDATWLTGRDAVNGAPLATALGTGAFPVRTGQATLVAPAAGLSVAIAAGDTTTTVPGQTAVLLAEVDLSQAVADDNSSAIDVGRLAFVIHGPDGQPLADPAARLTRLSLQSTFQEHFAGPPVVEQDSVVVLDLAAPLVINGNATLALRLYGDVATEAPRGGITPLVGPVDLFDARDGNMNNPVPVTLVTARRGPTLAILGPATAVTVAGTGTIPAQVSRGTRDLSALTVTLGHPGAPDTSPVQFDSLTFRFYNAARLALDPAPYLDRIRVMRDGATIGSVIDPTAADGQVTVAVVPQFATPGAGMALDVLLDVKPTSPAGTLEVSLGAPGVSACDAVSGLAVTAVAAEGSELPVSSGVANLVIPADEVRVAASSLMPPLLVPTPDPYPVLDLELVNPAPAGSGGVQVTGLTFSGEAADGAAVDLSRFVAAARLRSADLVLAESGALSPGATAVTLTPVDALVAGAGEAIAVRLEIVLQEDAPPGALRIALAQEGVGAGPPGGDGLTVRIEAASGSTFPFVSALGNIGAATLAESYANFPNPFAAGREPTTFAFSLGQDARIDLRIMTPYGELVAVILADEPRSAGFHQSDVWSGLNGNAVAVHNGVYLAELVVTYSDGSRERVLRKVAVVR